jgi:hypothetical protein
MGVNNQIPVCWNTIYNGGFAHQSDRTTKQNIKNLNTSKSLNKILKLRPVNYQYIQDPSSQRIGFISQEVEEITPATIDLPHTKDASGNTIFKKGLNYEELNNLYKEVYHIFSIEACKDPIKQQLKKNKEIDELNVDHLERYFVYYLKELNFFYGFDNFLKTNNNIKVFYNANINNVALQNNKISRVEISNINEKKISFCSKYFILS